MITYDKVRSEKIYKFLTALFLYQKTYFLAKSYGATFLIFLENTALLSSKRKEYLCFNRITLRNFTRICDAAWALLYYWRISRYVCHQK